MESRIILLKLFFVLFFLTLIGRLFYWQYIQSDELTAQARDQHQSDTELHAARGNILTTDGTWLAASTEAWLVYANPKQLTLNPKIIANSLAPLFVEDKEDKEKLAQEIARLENLLSKKDLVWVPLKQKINYQIREEIEKLELAGLGFEKQEARSYPEASAAAHLLGFVGQDDHGQDTGYFGLEGYYDLPLSGKPGFIKRESDALGSPLVFGSSKEVTAVGGADLVTHIDKTIQLIVENNLKEGIEKYGALSGNAIVMDPETGGILAMAAFPSYDPKKYYNFTNELFKNPLISDSFEPGSIFKPIIMAAGLDAGVIRPDTQCDICNAPYPVAGYFIHTWNDQYHANSTMTDVIKHSDNVGMTFVGNRLGSERLYDYLSAFGFGRPTNVDLQGEASPAMRERGSWNVVDLATTTFGQGIAVTPLQMIKAISIIANDGVEMKPQVVDKIKGIDWENDIEPEKGKQVISPKAAEEITQMMINAVRDGEAKWAVPKGFRVAGKTGTAQIPLAGHYDAEKTIASFVGFAPPENPRFVMLITLREPQSSQWASETSAPLWFTIAKQLFPYLGIQPEN